MFTEPNRSPRSDAEISRISSSVGNRPFDAGPLAAPLGSEFVLIAIDFRELKLAAACNPVVWLILNPYLLDSQIS